MLNSVTSPPALKSLLPKIVVGATAAGALVVAATWLFAEIADVSPEALTREPQVVLDGPFYVGAFSNLGAITFAIPAVACLLAASLLQGPRRRLLAAVGALSAFLLTDDLFLLHDAVFPRVGIPETVVQAGYLLAIGVIVLVFREELGLHLIAAVVLTLGWWALSVFMDSFLNNHPLNVDQLVEDGAKFVGIMVWSAAWTTYAAVALREEMALNRTRS